MSNHQPIDAPNALSALDHEEAHYRDIPIPAFDPPETITTKILSDISSSKISLGDIASKARTTLEALSLWLERPDIEARLNALEALFARRCRLQLADNTGGIINACNAAMNNYTQSESNLLFREDNLRGHAIMARKATNALTASRILLHLAKHFTNASRPVPPVRPRFAGNRQDNPTPTNPTPAPAPDLHAERADRTPRFTPLPPLPPLTPLKLHGTAFDPTHPTLPRDPSAPNPAHENGIQNPRGHAGATGVTRSPPPSQALSGPDVATGVLNIITPAPDPATTHQSSPSSKPFRSSPPSERTAPSPCTTCRGCNPSHPCSSAAHSPAQRARDPTPAHA